MAGENGWTIATERLVHGWDRVYVARGRCQEEVSRRERDLPWRYGLLGDSILRQSSLVLLGVTSPSQRRRGVNCYATRSLHYHISDAICSTGINAHRYFLPPIPQPGIPVDRPRMTFSMTRNTANFLVGFFFLYSGMSWNFFLSSFFCVRLCVYLEFSVLKRKCEVGVMHTF